MHARRGSSFQAQDRGPRSERPCQCQCQCPRMLPAALVVVRVALGAELGFDRGDGLRGVRAEVLREAGERGEECEEGKDG